MPELEQRPLGSSGIRVSCLGLGTVKIGRNQGVKYPGEFRLPDDAAVIELLSTARDLGINLLDTAPAYGESEARLGKLLTDREQWVICTKVGEEFRDGVSVFDFSAAHTRLSVERSLKRLRTDYLDLVLIHSSGADSEIIRAGDCLEALAQLKRDGLIRAFGISTKTLEGGLLAVAHSDVVMVTYNPALADDGAVIDAAHVANKGVLIKKALASGHLEQLGTEVLDPVARSLRFIFDRPGVSSVIVGTLNPDHLRQNVNAAIDALG